MPYCFYIKFNPFCPYYARCNSKPFVSSNVWCHALLVLFWPWTHLFCVHIYYLLFFLYFYHLEVYSMSLATLLQWVTFLINYNVPVWTMWCYVLFLPSTIAILWLVLLTRNSVTFFLELSFVLLLDHMLPYNCCLMALFGLCRIFLSRI